MPCIKDWLFSINMVIKNIFVGNIKQIRVISQRLFFSWILKRVQFLWLFNNKNKWKTEDAENNGML